MRVFHGLCDIPKFRNPVVAIGVFDGVHRGHRAILKEAVSQAKAINGTSIVLTFYPHPQKQKSLYSLEHRIRLISEIGIDAVIILNFNKTFSKTLPEEFVKKFLVGKLSPECILVGENFNFGKGGKGDVKLLKYFSKVYKFKLKVFKVLRSGNKAISSTLLRGLIIKGRLKDAERLLLRPVSVLGVVIKGDSIAKKLGFPTANIDPHHEILPPAGVYAVFVILGGKRFSGVCSIGNKPTFYDNKDRHIEVHIFDFNKNIYKKPLEIRFIKKIRGQLKFSGSRALAEKIKKDIVLARKILFRHQANIQSVYL